MIKTLIKGHIGEKRTNKLNKQLKLEKDFYIINNLTIENSKGRHTERGNISTTQIDHVLISKNTDLIIVIESKNYNGIIHGAIDDNKWLIHYGKETYETQNPLYQNYAHIKTIQEHLKNIGINFKTSNMYSMVFFNGEGILNIEPAKKENQYKSTEHLFQLNCIFNDESKYEEFINHAKLQAKANHPVSNIEGQKQIYQYFKNKNLTTGLNLSSIINAQKHKQEIKRSFKNR